MQTVFRILMIIMLFVLSVMDICKRKIPFVILAILCGMDIVIVVSRIICGAPYLSILITFFLGILPGAAICLLAWITKKIGFGDGLLLAILGASESYLCGLVSLSIGCLLLSVVSVLLMMIKRINRKTEMPFIPFLSVGYVIWGVLSWL